MTGSAPESAPDGRTYPATDGHRPQPSGDPAAQAIDLRKVYGSGQTKVAALDGVTATFPAASSPRSWARPAPASRR